MGRHRRVLLVDLDDTLLDHRGAAREALAAWGRRAGAVGRDVELEARWLALETEHYRRFQAGELTKDEQRRVRVRAFLAAPSLTDEQADAAFSGYWQAYAAAWRAFPDALPAVRRAQAAGLVVGVLTNGDEADQARKLVATGLSEVGLTLLASSALGAAKPDPRCFRAACGALGVEPSTCVMVGDSLENDVDGARGVGMDSVLVDRHDRHRDHDGPRVVSLDELDF